MEIRCYSDFSDLPLDSAEWRCLTRGVPFRSKEWLKSWWDHYAAGSLYLLSAIHQNGSLIGLIPLRMQQGAAEGRCLRWLADGDVCTDYLTPLVGADHEADVCQAFADWLIENQSGRYAWDSLRLEGVAVGDRTMSRFVQCLQNHGAEIHQKPGLRCWRIELPASWDDYLAQMSKSHRKQIRRVERRVLDGPATRVVTVNTEDELREGMAILVDLHQRRRKMLDQPGCFADARFDGFLHQAASELLAGGMLELCYVEHEGKPVAAEFQLSGGEVTYAYQAGIDPDAMELEPGRLIMIATIRRAIERGQTAFDFLRGDEPYKAHWRAQPIELAEVRVAAPKTLSKMRHRILVAGDALKQWIRSSIPSSQVE